MGTRINMDIPLWRWRVTGDRHVDAGATATAGMQQGVDLCTVRHAPKRNAPVHGKGVAMCLFPFLLIILIVVLIRVW